MDSIRCLNSNGKAKPIIKSWYPIHLTEILQHYLVVCRSDESLHCDSIEQSYRFTCTLVSCLHIHVWMLHTRWHYAATVPWEILLFPPCLVRPEQENLQDSCCCSAIFRKMSPPALGGGGVWGCQLLGSFIWVKSSSATDALSIPSPVCFDMALGNRLDLNICMVLDAPAESSDSVLSIQSTRGTFKKHGCQCDSYVFWGRPDCTADFIRRNYYIPFCDFTEQCGVLWLTFIWFLHREISSQQWLKLKNK